MGCGSSSSKDVIQPGNNETVETELNGTVNRDRTESKSNDSHSNGGIHRNNISAEGNSIGNGNSMADTDETGTDSRKKMPIPEPIAFEVEGQDSEDGDGSLIKKHPPRRLRQTMEMQSNNNGQPTLTQEALGEKLQAANERRNQALNQRVTSARHRSARVGPRSKSLMDLDTSQISEEQQ